MKLTKAHISKLIAKEVGCTQKKSSEILSVLLETIKTALAEEGNVSLRKFGKFYLITRKPRRIKHPSTDNSIRVGERKIVRFKCSKLMEEEINVFRWSCDDPHNKKILEALCELIEESEIADKDDDDMMYYPGKQWRK